MGFLNSSLKVVSNIVTLGGASRLKDARTSYLSSYAEHEKLCADTKAYHVEIKKSVERIGAFLRATQPVLKKSEKILKKIITEKIDVDYKLTLAALDNAEKFNSEYNTAFGIGTGAVVGGSAALGMWALVGTLGSASTGAAISGLSGAAATNATLAWFGGGALAAGGAGITGGLAVLGGIVAIPLVCIATAGTHKKAREFEAEKIKLDQTIAEQRAQLDTVRGLLQAVKNRQLEIGNTCEVFKYESRRLFKIIRPFGILSAIKQNVMIFLRMKPFSEKQIVAIDLLSEEVSTFVRGLNVGTTAA